MVMRKWKLVTSVSSCCSLPTVQAQCIDTEAVINLLSALE